METKNRTKGTGNMGCFRCKRVLQGKGKDLSILFTGNVCWNLISCPHPRLAWVCPRSPAKTFSLQQETSTCFVLVHADCKFDSARFPQLVSLTHVGQLSLRPQLAQHNPHLVACGDVHVVIGSWHGHSRGASENRRGLVPRTSSASLRAGRVRWTLRWILYLDPRKAAESRSKRMSHVKLRNDTFVSACPWAWGKRILLDKNPPASNNALL